jgi:hypothetical protein
MARGNRLPPRKPAAKYSHLRKRMQQTKTQSNTLRAARLKKDLRERG